MENKTEIPLTLLLFGFLNFVSAFFYVYNVVENPDLLKNFHTLAGLIIAALLILSGYHFFKRNYRKGFVFGNAYAVCDILIGLYACAEWNIKIIQYPLEPSLFLLFGYPVIMLIYLNLFYKRWFLKEEAQELMPNEIPENYDTNFSKDPDDVSITGEFIQLKVIIKRLDLFRYLFLRTYLTTSGVFSFTVGTGALILLPFAYFSWNYPVLYWFLLILVIRHLWVLFGVILLTIRTGKGDIINNPARVTISKDLILYQTYNETQKFPRNRIISIKKNSFDYYFNFDNTMRIIPRRFLSNSNENFIVQNYYDFIE